MTNVEKVRDIVANYQKLADKWFADYNAKTARIRERYKEEAAKTEIMMNVWPTAAGTLWSEKEAAKEKIDEVVTDIKDDLRKWTVRPIKPETLSLLRAIRDFEIKLSINELKTFEMDLSGNPIAIRIFAKIAAENGYIVKAPSIDRMLHELKELETFAKNAIDAYAGRPNKDGTFPGVDLLDRKKVNGVSMGEWANWEIRLAADFVDKNKSLQRTQELFVDSRVAASYSLTESEEKRIKNLISEVNKLSEREKTAAMVKLFKNEMDLSEKMQLMGQEFAAISKLYAAEEQ